MLTQYIELAFHPQPATERAPRRKPALPERLDC